jgi:hypothetical protein
VSAAGAGTAIEHKMASKAAGSPAGDVLRGGAHSHVAAAAGWELFWLQTKALWRKRLLCAL